MSIFGVKTGRLAALVVVALVSLTACEAPGILTPETGPHTLYPCGVTGVECASGMCCPEDYTCGGSFPSVGCPAGACCFIGGDMLGADPRMRRVPQRPRAE